MHVHFFKTYHRPLILQLQLYWIVFLPSVSPTCSYSRTQHCWFCHVLFYLWPMDWQITVSWRLLRDERLQRYTVVIWTVGGASKMNLLSPYSSFQLPFFLLGFGIGSEILKNLSQVWPTFLGFSIWRGDWVMSVTDSKLVFGKQVKCQPVGIFSPNRSPWSVAAAACTSW